MNKLITLLFILLLTASYSPSLKPKSKTAHIEVHKELKPYMRELVRIVEENKLNVDWDKIQAVELIPLAYNIQGYWSNNASTVMISYYFTFPPYQVLTREEKDDFILLTLAHEVGHSQGLKHIDPDKIGLMSPHSKFELGVIRGSLGAEQFIINTYKNELNKKTPN